MQRGAPRPEWSQPRAAPPDNARAGDAAFRRLEDLRFADRQRGLAIVELVVDPQFGGHRLDYSLIIPRTSCGLHIGALCESSQDR